LSAGISWTSQECAKKNLLNGFAKASTDDFRQLCSQLAMINCSAVLQSGQSDMSAKKKIFLTLKDLLTAYLEYTRTNKWAGIGHDGDKFREQRLNSSLDALTSRRDLLKALAAQNGKPFKAFRKDQGV
jgi:hypothetical protein